MRRELSDVDLIIFDCDGVLVDSELIANREGARLKSELGFPISLEDHIRMFTGLGSNSPVYLTGLLPHFENKIFSGGGRGGGGNECSGLSGGGHVYPELAPALRAAGAEHLFQDMWAIQRRFTCGAATD